MRRRLGRGPPRRVRFKWGSFLLIALPFARGDGSRHFNPDGVRGPGPARAVGHAEFCQDERQTGPGFLIDDFPQPGLIAPEEGADCLAALNQRAQNRREGFDFIVRRNAFAGHGAFGLQIGSFGQVISWV